jgi:hypothetical protein
VEGHTRRLTEFWSELQVLLKCINYTSSSGMDAEMFKCKLKIRYVGFHMEVENLASNKDYEKQDLFREREYKRA